MNCDCGIAKETDYYCPMCGSLAGNKNLDVLTQEYIILYYCVVYGLKVHDARSFISTCVPIIVLNMVDVSICIYHVWLLLL